MPMFVEMRGFRFHLKTTFILGQVIIISCLVVVCVAAYVQTQAVKHFQNLSTSAQTEVVTATALRAMVRSQILRSLESVYIEEKFELFEQNFMQERELANDSFKKFEELHTHSTHDPVRRTEEIEEISNLKSTFDAIQLHLALANKFSKARRPEAAKHEFRFTKSELFEKRFLKQITKIIDGETRDTQLASAELEKLVKYFEWSLFALAIVAGIGTLLIGYYLSRKVLDRLKLLESLAASVAQGDYSKRVSESGSDEITTLFRAFNHMTQSLGEANENLYRQQQVIISKSKMSALGEMAGGMAHEINSPLAIIHTKATMMAKRIQQGELDPTRLTSDLEKIEKTTVRISKIIRGLQTFARESAQDPMETIALCEVLDDVFELCQERFRHHGVQIEVNCDPGIEISCRPAQIAQVLTNLLSNAFDAVKVLPSKWVRIDVSAFESHIEIQVTDSGTGIAKPVADKLMQPFFTTKDVGQGTGLGLSISKGIIEDHHGSLRYDERSPNTRFVIELPVPLAKQAGDSTRVA